MSRATHTPEVAARIDTSARSPDDSGEVEWSGVLFRTDRTVKITGYGALADEHYRRMATAESWSGVALLANWAPTAFTLDSITYSSVESFYHSLKYSEGSEDRARIAALSGPEAQHVASHRRGKAFQFRGTQYDVGSAEHFSFIAEAVVAKIDQHANVRAALYATDHAELTFPDGVAHRNVLGSEATLALMIERLKSQLKGRRITIYPAEQFRQRPGQEE